MRLDHGTQRLGNARAHRMRHRDAMELGFDGFGAAEHA